MREIKFRAWNKLKGGWEDKLCLYLDDSKIGDVGECFHNEEDSEAYDIQQYIGIKDKGGTKIYEGDFVRLFGDPDEVFEVVYDDYHDARTPAFVLESDRGYGDWLSDRDREVVGNIHEGVFKDKVATNCSPS